ncbi:DNA methylase [Asanoa ishikariensis]|uniref:site-specific DNA-methyltransferase (adenine-specific) n=1 Tax=Asanoa ishikariensis TaxID=137265 RepID=A0A1H3UXZ6_9ACTN|nr:BREX-2 system adenine-specific DNA-methyltransferase PglX [Asanoa ishikariensis]GIF65226.1 DNA methylase [Asanoa ishikariensis]SDZ66689.1 hypothetical protein SAMN05421684_8264 [Asanoa ishikariensis]
MIDEKALQGQVRRLVDDLRVVVADRAALRAELRQEYENARADERVGVAFEVWLDDVLDQAAVAWVLGCLFVRFCEDNALVEGLWIGGPEPHASVERALQHRQEYLIANPRENDREWLREAFRYLAGLRATAQIFDHHNQLWRFDISGPAAEELRDFFHRGAGFVSLRRDDLDTRWLGDVYERISAHARKTYALLQTPDFVEEFILDRTLEPSVAEHGLARTKVIDPTCGSGHFLLGAFHRLVAKWCESEPATDINIIIERVHAQITGVDINRFAVAIARFRMLVAGMKLRGTSTLERLPGWNIRVATGDSLLDWGAYRSRAQSDLIALMEGNSVFAYESEDDVLLKEYLRPGSYTVVIGNPPYIVVSDPARNHLYRAIYTACHRQYALTVPFAQRFFELAARGDEAGREAGHVGQITSNAFMRREFGTKLIEDFFANDVELTEIIDTSGAYIPGHGTPTVILIGRNRRPSNRYSAGVRAVLAVRGEPEVPIPASAGIVWNEIAENVDTPGYESAWISVAQLPRSRFSKHPWSLSGGGSGALVDSLEGGRARLGSLIESVGYTGQTNADSAMIASRRAMRRFGVEEASYRRVVSGEEVRDFSIGEGEYALFLYDGAGLIDIDSLPGAARRMWPLRTTLFARRTFAKTSYKEEGRSYWEWHQVALARLRTLMAISWGEVSTHNHFALDRDGKIFKQTAPCIKLPADATEEDHLRLLGVLNSSTACFWLKQVSHNKGSQGVNEGFKSQEWERFYQFNATKLEGFPLPPTYPTDRAREIDNLARRLLSITPGGEGEKRTPVRQLMTEAEQEHRAIQARMIALQEELDWEVYRLYGLIDEDLTCTNPPPLGLGERSFEIVLAAAGEQPEWFTRHGSTRITKPKDNWPAEYRVLVEKRVATIVENRHIALLERPECKRRWTGDGWAKIRSAALHNWLLDRLESPDLWDGTPTPLSVAQLAERLGADLDVREVLDQLVGHDSYDVTKALAGILAEEHVPFLPAHRYKPAGLRKRALWERTWALQRREDAGEKVEIEVPPKYSSADFARPSYWRARGKLDVPKERFISYPRLGRDADSTELLGWAGWDHLTQAQALATVYMDRRTQAAWTADKLLPALAGIAELEPWLHQWYAEDRPGYPGSPAEFFTDFINGELARLGADRSALTLLRGVPEA